MYSDTGHEGPGVEHIGIKDAKREQIVQMGEDARGALDREKAFAREQGPYDEKAWKKYYASAAFSLLAELLTQNRMVSREDFSKKAKGLVEDAMVPGLESVMKEDRATHQAWLKSQADTVWTWMKEANS